jgi:hypothetical protein
MRIFVGANILAVTINQNNQMKGKTNVNDANRRQVTVIKALWDAQGLAGTA